jgi:predicted membrane protein
VKLLLGTLLGLGPSVLLFVLSFHAAVESDAADPAAVITSAWWGGLSLCAFLGALVWPFFAVGVAAKGLQKKEGAA